MKHPLKANRQPPDFRWVCKRATDTQSVVGHCEKYYLTKKQVFDISTSMKRETMKDKITVTIGEQIRELLTKNGKTAYRMGKDLTLDQGYISRVLTNRVNPSYEFTKRMLNYLGYDIRFIKIKSQKKGGKKTKPKARRSTG